MNPAETRIRLVAMAEMHVVNFSSTIVMSLGRLFRWCYEKDPTTYGPFEPYLGMTTELKNNAGFYGAWHSICIEHKIAFEAAQCEYVYTQTLQPLLTSLTEYYGFDFTNASDALKGCVLSFGNRDGKYVVSLKRYFDGTTSASTDREIIERAYDAMIARRPNVSRWSYEKADCLAQLDGTLDIYAPSENGAGGIDWSWKKSIGAGESGNAAVQAALNAVGSGYSQSRRDDPGWYDCSSLVYRSYAAAGITYLNGMDAASEAECLVNKGMTVSYGELQPGDLIFYSYSANGKYRNISHVAIYLGNGEMVHAADESRGVCKQAMSQSNLSPPIVLSATIVEGNKMDKYEYIVNLAEKTAKRVSQNRESWMKFLTSAARIYKYPFKEQLLIYAQNPDATACASIEIWNKRMNCWVNKGSSGIALPDDTATYGHKLKYVFDVRMFML